VSSEAYHRKRPDLVILAVTSQVRPQASLGEVSVTKWKEAGLLKPSLLKPVLATIDRRLVLRKLGRLAEEDRAALRKLLAEILGT
jgi:mRNA interferase MazF